MSWTVEGHSHQHPIAWVRRTSHPKVLCSHSAAQELLAERFLRGCRARLPTKIFFSSHFSLYKASSTQTTSQDLSCSQPSQPWRNPGSFTPAGRRHPQTGDISSPRGCCDSLKGNPAARGIICIPNPNILCHLLHQKPTAFGKFILKRKS